MLFVPPLGAKIDMVCWSTHFSPKLAPGLANSRAPGDTCPICVLSRSKQSGRSVEEDGVVGCPVPSAVLFSFVEINDAVYSDPRLDLSASRSRPGTPRAKRPAVWRRRPKNSQYSTQSKPIRFCERSESRQRWSAPHHSRLSPDVVSGPVVSMADLDGSADPCCTAASLLREPIAGIRTTSEDRVEAPSSEDGMVAALPRRHRDVPRSWWSKPRKGEDGK